MRLTEEGEARSNGDGAGEKPPVQSTQRDAAGEAPDSTERGGATDPRSRPADPRDTSFAEVRFRFTPTYPYDTVLGRLQHAYVGTISDRSAYHATRTFLGALVAGELAEESLDEELGRGARALLDELLLRASDLGEVRVGEVYHVSEVEVSLPFRMVGATQEAVGELILANHDGRWYTADVQIEYRDRPADRRFDPAATTHRALR